MSRARVMALALALVLPACAEDGNADAPDARAAGTDAARAADAAGDEGALPLGCVAGRAGEDRLDDSSLDQVRVLYVTPSDGPDAQRDTNGQMCNSVRAFATWFHDNSGAYLRFDTMDGLVDIGFVRLEASDAEMQGSDPTNATVELGVAFVRNRIELELERRGLIAENKLYAVYYEGTSVYACGGGAWPPLIIDRVAAMYLGAQLAGQPATCSDVRPWGQASLVPEYVDYAMLHEVVHTLGFVPDSAPNEQSAGHVFDTAAGEPARDLMYSPRPGTSDPYWNIDHPDGLLLDLGGDDYFGAGGAIDLSRSSLLAPLPEGAQRPIGW